jgi:hypothetical protein
MCISLTTSIEDELEKEFESAEIYTDLYFTSSQTEEVGLHTLIDLERFSFNSKRAIHFRYKSMTIFIGSKI